MWYLYAADGTSLWPDVCFPFVQEARSLARQFVACLVEQSTERPVSSSQASTSSGPAPPAPTLDLPRLPQPTRALLARWHGRGSQLGALMRELVRMSNPRAALAAATALPPASQSDPLLVLTLLEAAELAQDSALAQHLASDWLPKSLCAAGDDVQLRRLLAGAAAAALASAGEEARAIKLLKEQELGSSDPEYKLAVMAGLVARGSGRAPSYFEEIRGSGTAPPIGCRVLAVRMYGKLEQPQQAAALVAAADSKLAPGDPARAALFNELVSACLEAGRPVEAARALGKMLDKGLVVHRRVMDRFVSACCRPGGRSERLLLEVLGRIRDLYYGQEDGGMTAPLPPLATTAAVDGDWYLSLLMACCEAGGAADALAVHDWAAMDGARLTRGAFHRLLLLLGGQRPTPLQSMRAILASMGSRFGLPPDPLAYGHMAAALASSGKYDDCCSLLEGMCNEMAHG